MCNWKIDWLNWFALFANPDNFVILCNFQINQCTKIKATCTSKLKNTYYIICTTFSYNCLFILIFTFVFTILILFFIFLIIFHWGFEFFSNIFALPKWSFQVILIFLKIFITFLQQIALREPFFKNFIYILYGYFKLSF